MFIMMGRLGTTIINTLFIYEVIACMNAWQQPNDMITSKPSSEKLFKCRH